MRLEYLLFDILILLASTLSVWSYPTGKLPQLMAAAKAITLVAVPFIIWDMLVTNRWWYFNEKFITGIKLVGLPIEEILFFFIVPWSCLILWVNLKSRVKGQLTFPLGLVTLGIGIIFLLWTVYFQLWYSATMAILIILVCLVSWSQQNWLQQKNILILGAIVICLTTIFNGYLTARPVVTYNLNLKSNINVYTIPIEDYIYGLTLVFVTVFVYEKLKTTRKTKFQLSA